MPIKVGACLLLLVLVGCKSTPPEQVAQCQVGVKFGIAPSVDSRDVIDFEKIQSQVGNLYDSGHEKELGLYLVKAYVRPGHLILKATAVVAQPHPEKTTAYYRSSVVDANLANMDGEYQSALNEAVLSAIQKAVDSHVENCSRSQA